MENIINKTKEITENIVEKSQEKINNITNITENTESPLVSGIVGLFAMIFFYFT